MIFKLYFIMKKVRNNPNLFYINRINLYQRQHNIQKIGINPNYDRYKILKLEIRKYLAYIKIVVHYIKKKENKGKCVRTRGKYE